MLSRRVFAAAFGAGAWLAFGVGAACSESYADGTTAADAASEASATEDATGDESDAAVADTFVPPAPAFVELATGLGALGGISATDTTVYFTEPMSGAVRSVPIGGGPVSTVASKTPSAPGPIVAAGGYLVWADTSAPLVSSRTDLGGPGAPVEIATSTKDHVALAASADRVVLLSTSSVSLESRLEQRPLNLSTSTSLTTVAGVFDVAVGGTTVYWTAPGQISRGAIGATTDQVFAGGETGCESIAANAAGAYWTRPSDGLVRTQGSASLKAISLTTMEVSPSSIAVDDTDVYWLTGDGRLRRKTLGQELPPATLATGFKSAFAGTHVKAIALTTSYVVWLTTDGRVLRIAK